MIKTPWTMQPEEHLRDPAWSLFEEGGMRIAVGLTEEDAKAAVAAVNRVYSPKPKYSAEWVEQQAEGKAQLDHHDCCICGCMVAYRFHAGAVLFDPSCGCPGGGGQRASSWQEIADWLAMQPSDDIRDQIMTGLR